MAKLAADRTRKACSQGLQGGVDEVRQREATSTSDMDELRPPVAEQAEAKGGPDKVFPGTRD